MNIQHRVNQTQKQKYQMLHGHSSLKRFCSTIDLPAPVTSHPYNSHTKKLSAICEKQCQENLTYAANRLKLFLKKNKDNLVDCAVTVNGTW